MLCVVMALAKESPQLGLRKIPLAMLQSTRIARNFSPSPGDVALPAEKIMRIILDQGLGFQAGCINKQRIASEFSVEKMCRLTASLIISTMMEKANQADGQHAAADSATPRLRRVDKPFGIE